VVWLPLVLSIGTIWNIIVIGEWVSTKNNNIANSTTHLYWLHSYGVATISYNISFLHNSPISHISTSPPLWTSSQHTSLLPPLIICATPSSHALPIGSCLHDWMRFICHFSLFDLVCFGHCIGLVHHNNLVCQVFFFPSCFLCFSLVNNKCFDFRCYCVIWWKNSKSGPIKKTSGVI